MIQRVQSIYLLGAFILLTICFFIPLAELSTSSGLIKDFFSLKGFTLHKENQVLSLLLSLFSGITSAILLANIFQFKHRKRQMKICIILIFLLIIIDLTSFYQVVQYKKEIVTLVSYKIPFVFPIISAVLVYLAYLGIKKDEELVKSYDRLR